MSELASNAPSKQMTTSWFRVAVFVVPVLHFLSAAFHVYCGALNADEGFYAIAARSVMEGDVPYRDFGYTQMPLLPYVNGPLLALIGYGLFEQRWLNGFWGALALIVAALWVARRTNRSIALGLVASFSLSPGWMYHVHLGKTYGFTSLVVMLAAWVFAMQAGSAKKQLILGLLSVVGIGCRLPSAPFFAVLWLAAFWHEPSLRWSRIGIGFLGPAFLTVTLLGSFYILAPEATWFWLVDFHVVSVSLRSWYAHPADIFGLAPMYWVALAVLLLATVARGRFIGTRDVVVGLAAITAIVPNLFARGAYVEYAVPFLLPLAGATVCELQPVVQAWSRRRKLMLAGGLVAAPILIPALVWSTGRTYKMRDWQGWVSSDVAQYTFDLPARLARACRIVEELAPALEPLLGPNIILAAEMERPVPRNARMGPFTMTAEFSTAKARQLNLLTYSDLREWLADPSVKLLAFFTTPRANYAWSIPSFKLQPRDEAEEWLSVLRREFVIVQQDLDFLLVARPRAASQSITTTPLSTAASPPVHD